MLSEPSSVTTASLKKPKYVERTFVCINCKSKKKPNMLSKPSSVSTASLKKANHEVELVQTLLTKAFMYKLRNKPKLHQNQSRRSNSFNLLSINQNYMTTRVEGVILLIY